MPCEGESSTTTSGSSLMFLPEQELKPSGMWWRSTRRWCCGLQAWRTISVKARRALDAMAAGEPLQRLERLKTSLSRRNGE